MTTILNVYIYKVNKNGKAYRNYCYDTCVEKESFDAWKAWAVKEFPNCKIVSTDSEIVEIVDDNDFSDKSGMVYTARIFYGTQYRWVRMKLIEALV